MCDIKRRSRLIKPALAILCAGCFIQPAAATNISGLGLPSDHADLAGATVVDFAANVSGDFAASFTYGNVTLTGNNVLRVTDTFDGSFNMTGNSLALTTNDRTQEITFEFLAPVRAFGFNIGGTDQAWRLIAYSATSAILDTLDIPVLSSNDNGEWFGVSAPGIASARLFNTAFDVGTDTGTLDYIVLDNVSFANDIPEPDTIVLVSLGLLGLRLGRAHRGGRIAR